MSRLHVEGGEEAGEVLVAGAGFGDEGELGDVSREVFDGGADDGLDTVFFGGLVGAGGTVETHVIDEAEVFVA